MDISVRKTLTKDVQQRFKNAGIDIHSYLDYKSGGDISGVDKLIISLESLARVTAQPFYHILILDEIEAILEQIHGETCADRIVEVWDVLCRLIKLSTKVRIAYAIWLLYILFT